MAWTWRTCRRDSRTAFSKSRSPWRRKRAEAAGSRSRAARARRPAGSNSSSSSRVKPDPFTSTPGAVAIAAAPTEEKTMAMNLARHWWALALRGAAAIIFGVIALFWPPTAIIALVAIFGAYALVDGILNLVAAVRAGRTGQRWGALVFEGIVSLAVGILTLFFPGVTALALVLLVAAWSLVTGVAEVVAAIKLREMIQGEWLLALSGILSIAFGVLLFISPLIGAIAIAIWIGAYSVVFGALLVGLALRLRSWAARQQETQTPAGPVARPA